MPWCKFCGEHMRYVTKWRGPWWWYRLRCHFGVHVISYCDHGDVDAQWCACGVHGETRGDLRRLLILKELVA